MKILIAEDNPLLGKSLRQGLAEAGWTVDLARDGEEALYFAANSRYDVLLLDRMLPGISGDAVMERVRKAGNLVPIIMVTAKGALSDRVEGLENGADDYIVKPFEMVELLARIKALSRRAAGLVHDLAHVGELRIDIGGRTARIGDAPALVLTAKEFDLLATLVNRRGKLVTRDDLMGLLYEMNEEPESNCIDVLIGRLRRKLQGAAVEIKTIRGKGFILRATTPTT